MKDDRAIALLKKGDYVMHFDPEYDIWFKCQILKTTENFYVVFSRFIFISFEAKEMQLGTVEWDKHDLKPCVRRDSDQ